MNCADVRDRLDAFLEGRLDREARAGIEAHLDACIECRRDCEAARFLLGERAALPRSIDPPIDLWPRIHERIAPRRVRWLPLAAAAILLVATSSAVTLLLTRTPAEGPAAVPALEQGYIAQAAALRGIVERERDHLAPGTIETLERNLRIIDRAIADSRAALEADPGNPDLRMLLRTSHEQKVALLQQATRIAQEI